MSVFQVPLVNIQGIVRTLFEGLHLFHPIGAFSEYQPRLQVDLVPFFVRKVTDVCPRFFGASEVESTCLLAGRMRTRVHAYIGFSDVRKHSCQGADVLEL